MCRKVFMFPVFLLFALPVFWCGCAAEKEAPEFETTCLAGMLLDKSYNDRGMVYTGEDGFYSGISFFFDPESGVSVPLCAKVNCDHQGLSQTNPHPACDAYFSENTMCDAVLGDGYYYVACNPGEDGMYVKKFCRADTDGSNRRVVYRMDNAEWCAFSRYEEGYFIFLYYNSQDENGGQLEKQAAGVYLIDLKTGEAETFELRDNYASRVAAATISDGGLYYLYSYDTEDIRAYSYEDFLLPEVQEKLQEIRRQELWRYDLKTKEHVCVDDRVESADSSLLGYGYLYGTLSDSEVYLKDLAAGTEKRLNADRVGKGAVLCGEGVVFCRDGLISLWDFETGEYRKLGDCGPDSTIFLRCITDRWVYAMEISDGSEVYMPREKFMRGEIEWKKAGN